MEVTLRDLLTALHGMGFGALFLMAFSGALLELYRLSMPRPLDPPGDRTTALLKRYLAAMALLAWATVLSGAYLIYPWYRAKPPMGTIDLSGYPQRLLQSSQATSGWHNLGMEWKEHVGWFAPIAITMAAYVFAKHGAVLRKERGVRRAVLAFAGVALISAGVAGALGAFISKFAPVRGGPPIVLMRGE